MAQPEFQSYTTTFVKVTDILVHSDVVVTSEDDLFRYSLHRIYDRSIWLTLDEFRENVQKVNQILMLAELLKNVDREPGSR